ncbi:MAG: SDR family NAD(P)-dependent oxidoreductase [Planctomycetota bacterium]
MQREIDSAISCLRALNAVPEEQLEHYPELEAAVAAFYKKVRKRRRRQSGQRRKQADRETVKQIAAQRQTRLNDIDLQPEDPESLGHKSRTCYCCNQRFRDVHAHYHWLCQPCGDRCQQKRKQLADLSGYHAMVTGGRIKIGFQTAVWLLRCGATVHVTTRFPADAALRFAEHPEFHSFQNRLQIHELDFRNISAILTFVERFRSRRQPLDVLINNAAQSVRRSQRWHERLMAFEQTTRLHPNAQRLIASLRAANEDESRRLPAVDAGSTHDEIREITSTPLHGLAMLRDDDDRSDTREKNTWNSDLLETEPLEILEVLLVNSNAPALLVRGLVPLMAREDGRPTFIVNVVGADSMFSLDKSGYHPHVNMSKAALNMLTRSCARRLSQDGVFMNSVDTGWITHEGGRSNRERLRDAGFVPPYDHLDGAARVVDPILQVVSGEAEPQFGILFRNFKPVAW